VNALYLKAPWQRDFFPGATKSLPFFIPDHDPVDVATMSQSEWMGYAKRDGFTAVTLSYVGGDLQFLILLPDQRNGAEAPGRKLTSKLLGECAKLPEQEVVIYLPKFRLVGQTLSLAKMLQALGMKNAFDQPAGSANFDRIAPRHSDEYLALANVFHQAYLAVDERGTEASAATTVTLVSFGMTLKKPPEIHVDHPFLFAIQHRESGACLFLGRVSDPR
jgi:serpin B